MQSTNFLQAVFYALLLAGFFLIIRVLSIVFGWVANHTLEIVSTVGIITIGAVTLSAVAGVWYTLIELYSSRYYRRPHRRRFHRQKTILYRQLPRIDRLFYEIQRRRNRIRSTLRTLPYPRSAITERSRRELKLLDDQMLALLGTTERLLQARRYIRQQYAEHQLEETLDLSHFHEQLCRELDEINADIDSV